jgi:hypothetical protein
MLYFNLKQTCLEANIVKHRYITLAIYFYTGSVFGDNFVTQVDV